MPDLWVGHFFVALKSHFNTSKIEIREQIPQGVCFFLLEKNIARGEAG